MPPLKYGHKIMPEDLAGMIGLAKVGNVWYVDGTNGNNSNPGDHPDQAFATVSKAHSSAVANQHDVVVLIAGGSAGGGSVSEASITWSKSFTHLIGNAAPNGIAGRARVVASTADTSPFVTISGDGCIFKDVQFGVFVDSNINVSVNGERNYFAGVHFAGIGHATAGDDTAARALELEGTGGVGENLFEDCVVGLDTIARSTTNAELELLDSSTRNVFRSSLFLSFADNAGHLFIKADAAAAAVDRFTIFDRCIFHNAIHSTGTTMTEAIAAHGSLSGTLLLKDCTLVGATDWENSASGQVMIDGAPPTAGTSGLAVDVS